VQNARGRRGGLTLSAGGAAGLRLASMQGGTENDLDDAAGTWPADTLRHRRQTLHCPA
jgi:hypothetical protein